MKEGLLQIPVYIHGLVLKEAHGIFYIFFPKDATVHVDMTPVKHSWLILEGIT